MRARHRLSVKRLNQQVEKLEPIFAWSVCLGARNVNASRLA
ncbi:hypothetical protein RMSM_04429 [Rhodopirellula maiorica SM1]|uniref:Uncharacterized protein n=1 Tax=Rhodopirellula maiorica SM1 TaxID=1265738 RepID=M5RH07_9BACT|nr:hypothetical protein RMSM_04429 [Rhodopirellula maiorica SM1]